MDQRILKLLSLASSDNDAEALLALRKAISLMKETKVTWESIVTHAACETKYEKLLREYNDLANRFNAVAALAQHLQDKVDAGWLTKIFG